MARGLEAPMSRSMIMAANVIQKITSDQFDDRVILKKADALVKISTTWSGTSQMLCGALEDLARKYSNEVNFFSMDLETESSLGSTYCIDTIPTLLFFKKGTLVDKLSGLNHTKIISNKINQLINS